MAGKIRKGPYLIAGTRLPPGAVDRHAVVYVKSEGTDDHWSHHIRDAKFIEDRDEAEALAVEVDGWVVTKQIAQALDIVA